MRIKRTDLLISNSLTTSLLKQLRDKRDSLRAEADRINETYNMLINRIGHGDITDTNDIDAAISWINHSNLSPTEIIDIIIDEKGN